MRRPHPWRAGLALALTLVSIVGLTIVPVESATGAPTDRVRAFFADANRIIVDPAYDGRPDDRLAAVRQLVTEMVDFRHAASVALGDAWSARSAGERDEFVRLFTDLLETSVFASVGARARIDGGISVAYLGEVKDDDATMVMTTLVTRSGRELAIGYRMTPRDASWVVGDVVVDGVSLVDNYRAQFQKFMQRSSYAALVSEMRTRTADLGRPSTAAAPGPPVRAIVTRPTTVAAAGVPAAAPAPVAAPTTAVAAVASVSHTIPAPATAPANGHAVTAAPPARSEIAAAASGAAQPLIVAAITTRDPRPAEVRRPDARALEPLTSTARAERFWVQVGAFRSQDRAIEVADALRDQTVTLFAAPADPLLRVVVGPFGNRGAAASKLREIRARGYDAFISGITP